MNERPPYPQKFLRVIFTVECEWTDEGGVDPDLVRHFQQVIDLSREDLITEAIDNLAGDPITDHLARVDAVVVRGEYRMEDGEVVTYERRSGV